jgi:hypothetical protein
MTTWENMFFSKYRSVEDIRWHHFLSYWFFIWFLVYYVNILSLKWLPDVLSSLSLFFYRYANPSLCLRFGVLVDAFVVYQHLYYGVKSDVIFKFILINVFIKLIPLYLLWNIPLLMPNDLYLFIGITLVYMFYLQEIGTSVQNIYSDALMDNLHL